MKTFKPEVFQGNKKRSNYFEGWYFKQVSADTSQIYSFIPGVSLSGDNSHSFIQVINGVTGQTQYVEYPIDAFHASSDKLEIKVGNSHFNEKGFLLNIEKDIRIKGEVNFGPLNKYPRTLWSPGIMGWYSYVPFMETKHGVVSMSHTLMGTFNIDNQDINFNDGKGYIEKDWGRSFPEAWIWLQCNNFTNDKTSFMLSIAKIPWLGQHFIGFLSFLYIDGKLYRFATYNGSKLSKVEKKENGTSILITNNSYKLEVEAQQKGTGTLKAPQHGAMDRHIKESVDSEINIKLTDNNDQVIYEDHGIRAGMEVMEGIFNYF